MGATTLTSAISVLVLGLVITDVSGVFRCPKKNDLVPHPTNCRYYYRCTNWSPSLSWCASGQHFNGGRRRCMSPSQAFCQTKRWRILLRASAGDNLVNLYQAWAGSLPVNDCNCTLTSRATGVKGTYRSKWVDDWHLVNNAGGKVQMSIYENGSLKKHVVFNSYGTSKHSFFSRSKIISSSWTDLKTSSQNYFSIYGHKLNSYSNVDDFDRRFYIWKNYGGCNNDKGWFMVADLLHGPGRCSWERRNIYARDLPFFLYNNYPTARHPSVFRKGHVFVLWGYVNGDYGQGCYY